MPTATSIHPILKECVATEISRYDMTRPFFLGGFTYATDGPIAARQRGELADATTKPPPMESLPWNRANYCDDPLPMPAYLDVPGKPRPEPCPRCEGTGDEPRPNTEGELCDYCEGSKVWIAPEGGMMCGPVKLNHKYLRILAFHGCTAYANKADPRNGPVYWTHPSGVDGLLMPMSQDVHNDNDHPNCKQIGGAA